MTRGKIGSGQGRKVARRARSSPLVLVVDDFEDNRAMYVEYLVFRGFHVAEAVNGAEAVARARDLSPAVIIMDLSLPVMDGWEATRRIKANPKTKNTVIIALTGHAEDSHVKRARDAGCDDFVAKPCLPEDLISRIRDHLARKRQVARGDAAAAAKGGKK